MDEMRTLAAARRLDDEDLHRARAISRRWWGSTFAAVGIVLLAFFVAAAVFLLWLWSIVKGSPTIS